MAAYPDHKFDPSVIAAARTHLSSGGDINGHTTETIQARATETGSTFDNVLATHLGSAAKAAGKFIPRVSDKPKTGASKAAPAKVAKRTVVPVTGPDGPVARGVTVWTAPQADTAGSQPNPTVVTARPDGSRTRVRPDRTPDQRAESADENTPDLTPAQIDKRNAGRRNVIIPGSIHGPGAGSVRGPGNVQPYTPSTVTDVAPTDAPTVDTSGLGSVVHHDTPEVPEVPTPATDKDIRRTRSDKASRRTRKDAVETVRGSGPVNPVTGKPQGAAGEKAITEHVPTDATGGRELTGMSISAGGLNDEIPTHTSVEADVQSRTDGGSGVGTQFSRPGIAPVRGNPTARDHLATGAGRPPSENTTSAPSSTVVLPFSQWAQGQNPNIPDHRLGPMYAAHKALKENEAATRDATIDKRITDRENQ